jgi:hypothetical protein
VPKWLGRDPGPLYAHGIHCKYLIVCFALDLTLLEQRWHVVNYPTLAPDAFWVQVDKTIRENFKEGATFANE